MPSFRSYTPNTSQLSWPQQEKRTTGAEHGYGRRRRQYRMRRPATDPSPTTSPIMGPSTKPPGGAEDIVVEEGFKPYKFIPAAAGPISHINKPPDSPESPAAKNQISESPRPTAAAKEDDLILTGAPINPYKNILAVAALKFPYDKPDGAHQLPSIASPTSLTATGSPVPTTDNQISEYPRPTAAATEDDLILTGAPINSYKGIPAAATPKFPYNEPDAAHHLASIASPTWLTATDSPVPTTDQPKTWHHFDPLPTDPPGPSIVTTSRTSGCPFSSVTSLPTPSVTSSLPRESGAIQSSSFPSAVISLPETRFSIPTTRSRSWTTCTRPKSLFPDPATLFIPPYSSPETTSLPPPTPILATDSITPTPTTTPTETPTPESSGGNKIAMYVAIPTSICAVAGILAFGIWRYKKRRKQRLLDGFKDNIQVIPNSSPRPGAMQGEATESSDAMGIPRKEWWEGAYEYD